MTAELNQCHSNCTKYRDQYILTSCVKNSWFRKDLNALADRHTMNAQPLLVARQFMFELKFWGILFIIWATYLECKTLQNRSGKKYNMG